MADQIDKIKSIFPHKCPHCGQDVFIEFSTTTPVLDSLYTKEDVVKAKNDVLLKLTDLDIPQEKKDEIILCVTDPITIFGPSEVDLILDSIKKDDNSQKSTIK
jgi:hypothetical protein